MATHITTAASSFVTANMKPNVNENGDALWAMNIGDNLGHLWFKAQSLPIVFWQANSGAIVSGLFYKTAAHSHARVSFAANANIGAITATLTAFTSTSDWGNYSGGVADPNAATVSAAITLNADTAHTLELDLSSLTNGNLYYLRFSFSSSVSSPHPPGMWLIHGAGATY